MSDSYARVLREIVGEPVVTGELWDTVTSVGEGDAGAYAEAIAAITRACGVASVDGALRDESTPGAVLDVMVDRFERYSGFFKPIAAHPNITPRVEEYCLSKRRVALNESLAASAGVSAEAVEKLLRSKSRGVIGALLGNSSLSEEQLRRAEWRARSIGTPMWLMARDACKNRAMPVDVVLSWLSDCHARQLLDAGLAYYAVFVACASSDTLTRVADFALARPRAWKRLLRDVAAHRNTPPEVRRELVRWFPESLWLVARDGFLGRARLQK